MIRGQQGLPFSTSWICAAHVRAGTHKGEAVIRFDGKLTEYEPGTDALDALLSLDRRSLSREKPSADAIAFFEQYGPVGLYFSSIQDDKPIESTIHSRRVWTVCAYGDEEIPLTEHWGDYHSRSFASTHLNPELLTRAEVFTHGYFERWNHVFNTLNILLWTASRLAGIEDEYFKLTDGEDNLSYINSLLNGTENSLRPAVRRRDGNLEWSFVFNSLQDALLGLMVQRIIGGSTFATCQPCGRLFTTTPTGRKYCSDACMIEAQEIKRRESALLKGKRRLRELLRTRVEKHGLAPEKAEKIRQTINGAQDMATLQVVAEKYRDVFARHTRNGESQKGRTE